MVVYPDIPLRDKDFVSTPTSYLDISMLNTLHNKEYLIVSDLCYTPKAGDIVVVHKINAAPYNEPIVKRVIAVGGQTVDIDFATWTLRVD